MKNIKIAIVGGGWVGCHLAKSFLSKGINFTLFEKKDLFTSTSYRNQNRLHLGFHYARSKATRTLCKTTFDTFIQEYPTLVKDIPNNIYTVHDDSIMDLETYRDIFKAENLPLPISNIELKHCQGSVITQEKYIDFKQSKHYFKSLLKDHIVYQTITNLKELASKFDYVINCTNNVIPSPTPSYYELSLSLLYNKINPTQFGALTIVDGPFFSIFPYEENTFTLTDVEHTPIITSENLSDLDLTLESLNTIVEKKNKLIVDKVSEVYPQLLTNFIYKGYYTSIKTKTYNTYADRSPVISFQGNIIHCFTGKIQGIFNIENSILNALR